MPQKPLQQKLTETDPNLKANPAFIQGAAQAAQGRAATKEELGTTDTEFGLIGATTGDVLRRFGIEPSTDNPKEPIDLTTGISESQVIFPESSESAVPLADRAGAQTAPILASTETIKSQLAQAQQTQIGEAQKTLGETKPQKVQAQESVQSSLERIGEMTQDPIQTQKLFEQTLERFGIDETDFIQLDTLNTQLSGVSTDIAALLEKRERIMSQTGAPGVPGAIIRGQIAQQVKEIDSQIAGKSALAGVLQVQMQGIRNNVATARTITGDIVNAAIFDQRTELNNLVNFVDLNRDLIKDIDAKRLDALDTIIGQKREELQKRESDMRDIAELVLAVPTASWDAVNIRELSLEDAVAIAREEQAKQAEIQGQQEALKGLKQESFTDAQGNVRRITFDQLGNVVNVQELGRVGKGFKGTGTGTGITSPGFASSKIEEDVREDIVDIITSTGLNTIQQGELFEQTYLQAFNTIRALYNQNEVSDEGIIEILNTALGIQPADLEEPEISTEELPGELGVFGTGAETTGGAIGRVIAETPQSIKKIGSGIVEGAKNVGGFIGNIFTGK